MREFGLSGVVGEVRGVVWGVLGVVEGVVHVDIEHIPEARIISY